MRRGSLLGNWLKLRFLHLELTSSFSHITPPRVKLPFPISPAVGRTVSANLLLSPFPLLQPVGSKGDRLALSVVSVFWTRCRSRHFGVWRGRRIAGIPESRPISSADAFCIKYRVKYRVWSSFTPTNHVSYLFASDPSGKRCVLLIIVAGLPDCLLLHLCRRVYLERITTRLYPDSTLRVWIHLSFLQCSRGMGGRGERRLRYDFDFIDHP